MTWSATLEVAVAPSNDLIVVILIGFGLKFSGCFHQENMKTFKLFSS
jgi:hypothetical protein